MTPRNPRPVYASREKTVDIPQWAKDEGHNGNAKYRATVSPEGKLVKLQLVQSSGSPAIDDAVKARAETLYYAPATDAEGTRIEGTIEIRMGYARYDSDSPGGGFRDYTCGALVREWDWFYAAHGEGPPLFWPKNAYTSLSSVNRMMGGARLNGNDLKRSREKREGMWDKLIKRCRKNPDKLMLDEVDQPEDYLRLVDSF